MPDGRVPTLDTNGRLPNAYAPQVALDALAKATAAVPNTPAGRAALASSDELKTTIAAQAEALAIEILNGMKAESGPDVSGAGDSKTAGAGGGGTSWPSALQAIISAAYSTPGTVRNLGVGGEKTATIIGRTSLGTPWLATLAGPIPTSGYVALSLVSASGAAVQPLLQGAAGVNPVRIGGVYGTITLVSGEYRFTPTTYPASPIAVPAGSPVSTDAQRTRQGDITVYLVGQNDDPQSAANIISYVRPAIARLKAFDKKYIVAGLDTGTTASRSAMEAELAAEFGSHWLNLRTYISSSAALLAEGITPTTDDNDRIAVGSCPSSFWASPTDPVHRNAAGYRRYARAIYEKMKALGYNKQWGTLGDDSDAPIPAVVDTFNRTSASLSGTAPEVGTGTWLVIGGSSIAYIDNGALAFNRNGSGESIARLIAPSTNVRMVAKLKTRGGGGAYMRLRYADPSNYLRLFCVADGVWKFSSIVAGVETVHGASLGNAADGDVLDVTVNGTNAVVKINGTSVWSGTIPTFGSNPQACGFSANSLSDAQRWDEVRLY